MYPALDRLLSDDYELEDRMMLEGKIYRGEELIGKDIALNDIVIGREGHLRVIRFKNYVNDAYMNSYNADGIIIPLRPVLPDIVCQREVPWFLPVPV